MAGTLESALGGIIGHSKMSAGTRGESIRLKRCLSRGVPQIGNGTGRGPLKDSTGSKQGNYGT